MNHFLSISSFSLKPLYFILRNIFISDQEMHSLYVSVHILLSILLCVTILVPNSSSDPLPPQILCGKPFESGSCHRSNNDGTSAIEKPTSRYFYNTMNNSCQEHLGCETNGNSFDSPSICAAICGAEKIVKMNKHFYGVKPMETCFKPKPSYSQSSVKDTTANQGSKSVKLCDTKLRFYFDSDRNVCHQFLYDEPCNKDGMDESGINVFDSEESCSTSCPVIGPPIFLPFT